MNWISVKNRLPEQGNESVSSVKVLVAIKAKNGVTIRTQTRFKQRTYSGDDYEYYWMWRYSAGEVTHWMPLPAPPKEIDENESN